MNAYSTEDTIIAYFDGRLTDAEGAELLHRVSISPEIRELFEQHSALREMAVRAVRQTTIAPELEASLFRRIEALHQEEKLPAAFWSIRRLSLTGALAALLLFGVVHSFEFGNSVKPQGVNNSAVKVMPAIQYDRAFVRFDAPSVTMNSKVINGAVAKEARTSVATEPESSHELDREPDIAMQPVPRTIQPADIEIPGHSTSSLESLRSFQGNDEPARFELGVSSPMSGFVAYSNLSPGLFSDVTIRVAYNIDPNNQIGIEATGGGFVKLNTTSTNEKGYTSITGAQVLATSYAEELVYRRREAVGDGLFYVIGGIGGGIYSLGTVFTAELGIQVPFGNRMLGGVSIVADRLHQSGASPSDMVNASSIPAIYSGARAVNTLMGHIEYALSYQF